jgi:transcriptional regulator with XRE-family HTH domain
MQAIDKAAVDTPGMSGGNRRTTPAFRQRREALGITAERFYKMAGVSRRALHNAERGEAGAVTTGKVERTLARLEAGEDVPEVPHVVRVELRPGVYVTVDAENFATLGDVREVESRIRRLIDSDPS